MNIKTVLCPVDFSSLSRRELRLAVDSARRFNARIVLEHNLDPQPPGGLAVSWMWREEHASQRAAAESEAEGRLRTLMAELPSRLVREARLTRGPIDETLLQVARDLPADLLVMGTHGWDTAEHRSVTERVLLHAPCPVLTISEETSDDHADFHSHGLRQPAALLAIEFGRHGRRTLGFGLDLCAQLGLRPLLLHVESGNRQDDETRRQQGVKRLMEMLPRHWRGRAECISAAGRPASTILEQASRHEAVCLMMGCRQRFSRLLVGGEDTARLILHESRYPVWFLPPGVRVSGRLAA